MAMARWSEAQARTAARSTDQARSWAEAEGRTGDEGEIEGKGEVEVEVGVEGEGEVEGEVEVEGEGEGEGSSPGTGVQIGRTAGTAKRSVGAVSGRSGAASCQAMPAWLPAGWPASCTAGGGGSESIEKAGPGSRGLSAKQRRQRSASGGRGCEQRWQSMWRNLRWTRVGSTILPSCGSRPEALFTRARHGGVTNGHPHGEGHLRHDRGPGRPAVGRPDAAVADQLQDRHREDAGAADQGAGPGEAG